MPEIPTACRWPRWCGGLSETELLTSAVELAVVFTEASEPDPLLPPELLPRPRPGAEARARSPAAGNLLLADPKPGAPRLCRPADVSLERVRELVAVGQAESLTSEYKESFAQKIPDSVAAMANSYGGLILVGVTERKLDDRIIGFPSRRSFRSSAPATRSWNRRGSPRSSRCR